MHNGSWSREQYEALGDFIDQVVGKQPAQGDLFQSTDYPNAQNAPEPSKVVTEAGQEAPARRAEGALTTWYGRSLLED